VEKKLTSKEGGILLESISYLLKCIECGDSFFTEGEKIFYKSKGFDMPKRCKTCRDKKKAKFKEIQHKKKEKNS
jgi:hypothetical protein